jgi:CarboxypepD_reg-like domain/von Willebrand factor type A domain/Secretion system C-terminal sorting domain
MFCTLQFRPKRNGLLIKQMLIALLLIVQSGNAVAQKTFIKGKLINDKGEAIAFASVLIKDTKTGVETTTAGEFSLPVKRIPVTIQCSAIGYSPVEKTVTKKDFKDSVAYVTITINAAESKLDEVVVVGYGTSKKMSIAGSVATVSSRALEGKASGLMSSPSHAKPVKTRGIATVSSAADTDKEKAATSTLTDKGTIGAKGSRLLTAGEVNDFKKWKMWEDYNEADFKIHSEKWGLFATRRYSVQLQNNNFKAITGQTVYLINRSSNDTLWTAVSDNTGKAELWNAFTKPSAGNDLAIAVKNETIRFSAIPFSQGINRIVVNRSCAISNKVEIAFVVDATGSMQDEISYLKEELEDILTNIALKDPSIDLHTGSVFYRDNGDEYVTRTQPFTSGIASTIDFIKHQSAGGGGDYPEALKEALQAATADLQWSADARTKIIFLLMDAPPHDEAKNELALLIRNAAASGIRVVPVACSGTDKATEFIMRSMALATNGTYLFLTDDSGIGNGHIKPTTDEFKVELLNDLLQRIIEQMCFVNPCDVTTKNIEPISVFTNTEKVILFPNPTSGPVTLQTAKALKEIFVADFTGKILMRTTVKDRKGKYSIDLGAFPSATYFIRYTTKENTSGAEKVILVR